MRLSQPLSLPLSRAGRGGLVTNRTGFSDSTERIALGPKAGACEAGEVQRGVLQLCRAEAEAVLVHIPPFASVPCAVPPFSTSELKRSAGGATLVLLQ